MLFHMLKKELLKRKGVNIILFIFITLATVFLSSSVNNIMVITSAVDYYMEYANVPDVNIILNSDTEMDTITSWVQEQQNKGNIDSFDSNTMTMLSDKNVNVIIDDKKTMFDGNGASLFLSTLDVEYNQVYDENGETFTLQEGEIALNRNTMERNHLEVGDGISINVNGVDKIFNIKLVVKDAAFGSDMMGMIRFITSAEDYDEIRKDMVSFGMYYINCDDVTSFKQDLSNQSFPTVLNIVDRAMYQMLYSFDMLMAGLLILIGICLILIAMLVLRFTLVFTMEEQYQEIGILKAIGLRNWSIKKLYLMKYFVLVSVGALLGLLCSFPVSTMMVNSVSLNMIMERSDANYMINLICALSIVLLVLAFCYLCTKKLHKVSAITAIRGGSNGERFTQHRGLSLAKRKRMPVAIYLGFNDILCSLKRYAILIVTFCISFILITIPLNTVNTMKSVEMIKRFAINDDSKILLNAIELENEDKYYRIDELDTGLERVKQEMKEEGYDVQLTAIPLFFYTFSNRDDNKANIMTLDVHGDQSNYLEYEEGSAPMLENEIAFSRQVLKDQNWSIGDRVETKVDGEVREFIITGTYTDYMQLGKSARLNPMIDCGEDIMFDYNIIMVDFDTDSTFDEVKQTMQSKFPNYEWKTPEEFVNQNIGGIQSMIDEILIPMTMMLGAIVMLISWLMVRLFITREKGEIAMLRSAGFSLYAIRSWQMIRMISVVCVSLLISIPLSLLSNFFILKPIFGIMGANIDIVVEAWDAYVLYPGVLLIAILCATLCAIQCIHKINIREMNNQE